MAARSCAVRRCHEQDIYARLHGTQDRIADAITSFAYVHAAWFAVWIAL